MKKKKLRRLPIVGWREWVALPQLGIDQILCKVDTGARSSAIFATDIEIVDREDDHHDHEAFIRFTVQLSNENPTRPVVVEAPLLETRKVRSSNGLISRRPVVITEIAMLGIRWPIQITLANRGKMSIPMLLGRTAIRNRFLVDPRRSFLGIRRKRIDGSSAS